jgi:hypothetical protein
MQERKAGNGNLEASALGFGSMELNLGATAVELTADDLREIEVAASKITVQGGRYLDHLEKMTGL